jgi:hypothetical protein
MAGALGFFDAAPASSSSEEEVEEEEAAAETPAPAPVPAPAPPAPPAAPEGAPARLARLLAAMRSQAAVCSPHPLRWRAGDAAGAKRKRAPGALPSPDEAAALVGGTASYIFTGCVR